jgi:hypothetical protein
MGALTPTLSGPGPARRHVRWARRIAGVLATGGLLAVGVAIALMILPDDDTAPPATAVAPPAARQSHTTSRHKAKTHTGLTKAQKHARSAAVSTMRTQGYEPVRLADYDPSHKLRVLLGHRTGDSAGPRRAFFFAGGSLLGTDSPSPSTALKVSDSGTHWVTLSYGVYSTGDQACCPSGGRVKVRYALYHGSVTPVGGTIPSSYQRVTTGT